METPLHTIDLSRFRQLFPFSDSVSIGDDFCVISLRYDKSLEMLRHPCRFDGYLAFFCVKGRLKMSINMNEFDVVENSLFINVPGNIMRISEMDETQKPDLHFVVVAMSGRYVSGLKLDINKIFNEGMQLFRNPSFVLDDEEKAVAGRYLSLSESVLKSTLLYKRDCIGSLFSSLFYLLCGVIEKRIKSVGNGNVVPHTRSKIIFDRFISLVAEYHVSERTVCFYAGRLFLTPKYLSKVVKEVSGRSAPDWIDSYVILEAKNMLKYSDMTIKEIVARLNFPNASVFYRFFKSKTGLTPAFYRESSSL